MNYFTHGLRYLDRPYFLAGTAMPDLLSVCDRKVRLRSRLVQPFAQPNPEVAEPHAHDSTEFASGVLQHLHDDQWFHATPGFYTVTGLLAREFREFLDGEESVRPGFLGHIVTELLLDRSLMQRHPEALQKYYRVMAAVDGDRVQGWVNRMARKTTQTLAEWMSRFASERFLVDYLELPRMLHRLNQVLRRIKLVPLPAETTSVLAAGAALVESHLAELLPGEHFPQDLLA